MVSYSVLEGILPLLFGLFTLAMIIYSLRVFTSKSVSDMVLAVDALTIDLIIIFVLIGLYYKSPYLLIGVIPLAAWILILDIVVSRYLSRGDRK